MSDIPFVHADEVFALAPWRDAVDALERTLLDGYDPSGAPARSIIDVAQGQLLLMPAETATAVGVKLGTVAPENPKHGLPRIQATYALYDPTTLTLRALLDGTALTTLRTPAVSAVAVRHLAPVDAADAVVFGTGPQAWGHVQALRAVRPLRRVVVVARRPEAAEDLVRRLREEGLEARAGTADDTADADLVVCATTARQPLFDGTRLRPEACVVAVGSHEPAARELDGPTLAGAERVVVEDGGVALREAGDVILAQAEGLLEPSTLIDLASVVRLEPGTGRSVFKSVGMGWQDLVVAELVVRQLGGRRDG